MFRDFRHDYAYYAKRAGASATTTASPESVWQIVAQIGGDNGYYYMNILWDIRAAMDKVVSGPGLAKGRRHPAELHQGDTIDCWKVLAIEPERRLTLQFGMRAPGSGILEFEIEPRPHNQTKITVTAYWHPHGIWGLSYWYAMVPAHLFLFKGLNQIPIDIFDLCDRRNYLLFKSNIGDLLVVFCNSGVPQIGRQSESGE